MEVIPPSNLQNTQTPITQPSADIQPDEEKKESIFDFIKSSIFELFLVLLFSIIILTTFNYFNLIPLSSVFPALSFLPQLQSNQNFSLNQSKNDISFFNNNLKNLSGCEIYPAVDTTLSQIIKCSNPQTIINTSTKYKYQLIQNTDISSEGNLQISFALKINYQKLNYNDTGLVFGGDAKENRIVISYQPASESWGISFLYGNKYSGFKSIYIPYQKETRANFSLIISKDGKNLGILLPNGLMQLFQLEGSLYNRDGNIPTVASVAPGAQLTIDSLNYWTQ